MKYIEIEFMNNEFDLLSSKKSRKFLKKNGFKSVKLDNNSNSILVQIKDLNEIKSKIPLFLLNEDGTEMTKSDIETIIKSSSPCEED